MAGLYTKDECHIDLGKLCGWAGVRLIQAEACGLDTVARRVKLSGDRPEVPYDVLSINIGSSPSWGALSHSPTTGNVTPVKPIDGFSRRWDAILERVYTLTSQYYYAFTCICACKHGQGCWMIPLHAYMLKRSRGEHQMCIFTKKQALSRPFALVTRGFQAKKMLSIKASDLWLLEGVQAVWNLRCPCKLASDESSVSLDVLLTLSRFLSSPSPEQLCLLTTSR